MDQFDEHGDPYQHGVIGAGSGLTYMRGPAIGIVLSVHHSDDKDNFAYQLLTGDQDGAERTSHLEARVLMIFNGAQCAVELPNCIVLPSGKTSRLGPSEDEPSDFSEDVPNGCTAEELDFYGRSSSRGLDFGELSGDWVVVNFVGGILQIPIITHWYPNPKNKADASSREDGKRWRVRRNNTELQIDRNGDFFLSHRVGQYFQFKGKSITIKHRSGQTFHMDDEGVISLLDGNGNVLQMDEDGFSYSTEGTVFSVSQDGVRISTPTGKVNLMAEGVNLISPSVIASTGKGASALLKEGLLEQIEGLRNATADVNEQIGLVVSLFTRIAQIVPGLQVLSTALQTLEAKNGVNSVALLAIQTALEADKVTSVYRTTVLSGE